MRTLIEGGQIVNEGKCFEGSLVVEDEKIIEILKKGQHPEAPVDNTIDASGCFVLPGIIDTHVHFREPGLTEKADIESESRAAAAGGVTSYFEMPNTVPQTTTLEALEDKFLRAAKESHVNYSFFFGATNDNTALFSQLDSHRIPGIKLFMGSSTGNMLVDRDEALNRIFAQAKLPIMAHCEDTAIINRNMEEAKKAWGDDPQVSLHALIRSEEACVASTTKAVELAKKHKARLHVAHVSTAEELELIPANPVSSNNIAEKITAEVTVGHLFFSMLDHERLGARIKVNPAIKSPVDQFMLRQSLNDGRITTIATDHAPHLLSQKEGGCAKAASGMPMVQFSLPTMLELVDQKVLTIERLVQLMAHNPASLFEVRERGFIRKGYQADLTIVRPKSPWTVTTDIIESKCKWSPMEGHTFNWRVEKTFCNGHLVYNNGVVDREYVGQPLMFR
jgi:dihydroorotase